MEDLAESNPDSEDAIRDASEQLQDFFPTTAMIGLNSPNVSKKMMTTSRTRRWMLINITRR